MDLPLLLAWRRICRNNYLDVRDELRGSLQLLLTEFVPSPDELLSLVTRTRALMAGELALCYVLRDSRLVPHCLDIYLGNIWFDDFVDAFFNSPSLSGFYVRYSVTDYTETWIASRHTDHTVTLILSTGNTMRIHSAVSSSACHAIACSPTTLGTTFVMADCFATAYPHLTLNKRAIVCPNELPMCPVDELHMYSRLETYGFSYKTEPTSWFVSTNIHDQEPLPATSEIRCPKSLYICPQQGRYFGDGGSLLDFMDPLSIDLRSMKERGIPPYGHMAIWRLPSYVLCDEQCDELDDILPPNTLATPVMFEEDIFNLANTPTIRTSVDDSILLPSRRQSQRRSRTRTI